MAGRRTLKHRSLAQYPWLYVREDNGIYYVKHPITGKQASLETTDRSLAIRRWAILQEIWERDRNQYDLNEVAQKLSSPSPTICVDGGSRSSDTGTRTAR
jgi:hypothetical protein